MNNEEYIKIIQLLQEENEKLKNDLYETKEHLKKYTAPAYKKIYYENNKEEIKQKVKEYKEKNNCVVSKDVISERNKKAYQKKNEKEKMEKAKLENEKENM